MSARVLVTGAGGLIGSRALGALAERGYDVCAVSRTPPSAAEVEWHATDLLDDAGRRELVERVGASHLLHLAWCADHGTFWHAPENAEWVAATVRLTAEFAAAGGRRAVFAGTCAEYDWTAGTEPLRESSPLAPATFYGACKDATRRVVEGMAPSTAWGRVFFLYGPGEDERRLVPSVVRAVVAGQRASTTSGEQRRDFLHIDDVAGALVALLDSPVEGPVNIASGHPVTVLELVRAIADAAGQPELLDVGALPHREGDPASIVADVSRLRDEVGFVPARDLASGLAAVVGEWRARP